MLERILPRFGITNLPEDVKRELTLTWHRLNGWPDVRSALGRLAKRYKLAPVSNGNISMMADIAAHNGWRWDAILGADIAHDFKPKQDVYLAAAAAFSLTPAECMMVAAHEVDLVHGGASAAGLHTAFVARPNEYGLPTKSRTYLKEADVSVMSLTELANKLGA
jgi:2-haloacid dehalogenase